MSACVPIDADRCRRNLYRSAELFRACCVLREAWLRAQHPRMSARAIRRRVFEDILAAKEAAWNRPQN